MSHPPSSARRTQRERLEASSNGLLDAAVALFAERGYEGTSTGAIADRAGYSRSLVNARFGSKEGLLEVLVSTRWEGLLVEAAGASAPGLDRMLGVIDRCADLARAEPRTLRAFLLISFEAAGPSTVLRSHVTDRLGRIEDAFAAAIAAGVVDGSVRADADAAAEAREAVVAGLGYAYRWIIRMPGAGDPGELLRWRRRLEARLAPPR